MNAYVMVPVPEDLVTEVMRFIADHATRAEQVAGAEPVAEAEVEVDSLPEVPWTVEDLRRLRSTPNASARTISAMLTEMSKRAPEPMSTTELETATGIARGNIKGSLSAFTRHIKTHYQRSNWPMTFQWGPNVDPSLPAEAIYHVSVETAEMWRSITGE